MERNSPQLVSIWANLAGLYCLEGSGSGGSTKGKNATEAGEGIGRTDPETGTIHPIEELESIGEAQESPAFVSECDRSETN